MQDEPLPEFTYFWEHLQAKELLHGLSERSAGSPKLEPHGLTSQYQPVGSPPPYANGLPEEQDVTEDDDLVPWIGDLWDDQLSHSDNDSDPLTADLLSDEDVPGFTDESEVEEFDVRPFTCLLCIRGSSGMLHSLLLHARVRSSCHAAILASQLSIYHVMLPWQVSWSLKLCCMSLYGCASHGAQPNVKQAKSFCKCPSGCC